MLYAFYQKKHTKHILKCHLVTAEPRFTVKTIDCMHQTDLIRKHRHPAVCYPHTRCLPSLSLCPLLCQKWELFLSSIGVKVNGQYCWDMLLSKQILDAIFTPFITILSFSKTMHPVHLAFNTVQLLQHKTQLPFS